MFYSIARFVLGIYYHLIYKIKTEGQENFPKTGSVVLCANHISNNDSIVLTIVTKRRIHYMAKKELFGNKFFSMVLSGLGAIPVDRQSTDLAAYRSALGILNKGEVLGVFLQGKRTEDFDVKSAKTGAALFALKSGSCVVPVNISSSYNRFSKISVKYGKPIYLDDYYDLRFTSELLEEITENIMKNINELKE